MGRCGEMWVEICTEPACAPLRSRLPARLRLQRRARSARPRPRRCPRRTAPRAARLRLRSRRLRPPSRSRPRKCGRRRRLRKRRRRSRRCFLPRRRDSPAPPLRRLSCLTTRLCSGQAVATRKRRLIQAPAAPSPRSTRRASSSATGGRLVPAVCSLGGSARRRTGTVAAAEGNERKLRRRA